MPAEEELVPYAPVCYCGESVRLDSRIIGSRLMHNYSCLACNAVVDEHWHLTVWKAYEVFEALVRREERS